MKKSYIFIIILIIIIIIGVIIGMNLNKDNEANPTGSDNVENNIENEENNNITNNQIENETNTNLENTNIENNTVVQEPEENEIQEEPKTDLEKAIDIVEKDWGEDSAVYFAQDGQNENGEYIICVRDKNSTTAIAWYTVNLSTGTFTKEY